MIFDGTGAHRRRRNTSMWGPDYFFGSGSTRVVGVDCLAPGIQSNQPCCLGVGLFGCVASRCLRKARKVRMYATECTVSRLLCVAPSIQAGYARTARRSKSPR